MDKIIILAGIIGTGIIFIYFISQILSLLLSITFFLVSAFFWKSGLRFSREFLMTAIITLFVNLLLIF